MKTRILLIILLIFVLYFIQTNAQNSNEKLLLDNKTALLIIDIQMFYFPGGRVELFEPEIASLNSQKILQVFREKGLQVIHVRHNSEAEAEIHEHVKPLKNEKVISKDEANSFNGTDLHEYLKENEIKKLVICGMQTHMCVEAATRAAYDLGYKCIVISDACATRDLKHGNKIVKAEDVHNSTLSSLSGYYAKVFKTEEFFKLIDTE